MSDKFTEIKRAKVVINHARNSYSVKLIIPRKWAETMGLNADYRDIKLIFDGEKKIIIEKF